VTLCEALAKARRRNRAVMRRNWSGNSRVVLAWGGLWRRAYVWQGAASVWQSPAEWTPTYDDLFADNWMTVRP
jgi:hypothetical protein